MPPVQPNDTKCSSHCSTTTTRPKPAQAKARYSDWLAFDKAVKDAGAFVVEAGFQPATTARTVSVRDGSATTKDGAVVTTGNVIAGLYVVDVADADAAQDWAQRIPTATYGRVEGRPIVNTPVGRYRRFSADEGSIGDSAPGTLEYCPSCPGTARRHAAPTRPRRARPSRGRH